MVGKEEVLRAIGDGAVCTLNALLTRTACRERRHQLWPARSYQGQRRLPAAHLLDPSTNQFLPAAELRRQFEAGGAFGKRAITYCGGGIAASADAFALVLLGHRDVRLYDASLSEWAIDPTLPMETG
jgi:thiosulfate/3-mercaptopyruvate sulfurtransferase